MLTDMNEVLAEDWTSGKGILEEIDVRLAERLITGELPVCIFSIEPDGMICFLAITEKEGKEIALNLSDRNGYITEEMKALGITDLFYHDEFATDGCLAYLDKNRKESIHEQMMVEVSMENPHYYLCGEKKVSEVLELPAGNYVFIDCGELVRQISERSKSATEKEQQIGHRKNK